MCLSRVIVSSWTHPAATPLALQKAPGHPVPAGVDHRQLQADIADRHAFPGWIVQPDEQVTGTIQEAPRVRDRVAAPVRLEFLPRLQGRIEDMNLQLRPL